MTTNNKRYIVSRIGFVNFYGYLNETFNIEDGIAGFVGSNGSGKSVTTLSVLPNLLTMDDYKSMNIGSTEGNNRKISNYFKYRKNAVPMIGHISYIWIEFKKENNYKNLVIGYRNDQDNLKKEGFVGKGTDYRIDPSKDFFDKDNALLSIKQFKSKHKDHFTAYQTQKDYQQAVNHYLFDFSNQEKFDDMIRKIISSANSQKKNNKYRNSLEECIDILKNALPNVEDHPNFKISAKNVIDTIADRRRINREIKELKRNKDNITTIENEIKKINNTIYHKQIKSEENKARSSFNSADKKLKSNNNQIDSFTKNIDENKFQKTSNDKKIKELNNNIEAIDTKINNYQNSDIVNEYNREKKRLEQLNKDIIFDEKSKQNSLNEKNRYQHSIKQHEINIEKQEQNIEKIRHDLNELNYLSEFENIQNFDVLLDDCNTGYKELRNLNQNNRSNLSKLNKQKILLNNIENNITSENDRLDKERESLEHNLSTLVDRINKELLQHDDIETIDAIDITLLSNRKDNIYLQTIRQIMNEYNNKYSKETINVERLESELNVIQDKYNKLKHSDHTLYSSQSFDGPLINLYECIKFKPNTNPTIINSIEKALYYDNGLFTIMDDAELQTIKEGQIHKTISNNHTSNLFEYIELEDGMDQYEPQVRNALSEYHFDTETNKVVRNDTIIIPDSEKSIDSYIGVTAREKAKEEKLESYAKDIESLTRSIEKAKENAEKHHKTYERWSDQQTKIPNPQQYAHIKKRIEKLRDDQSKTIDEITSLNQLLNSYQSEREKIINDYFNGQLLHLIDPNDESMEVYYEIKEEYNEYNSLNKDLERYLDAKSKSEKEKEDNEDVIESVKETLDNLIERITERHNDIEKLNSKIKSLEESLNAENIDIPKLQKEKKDLANQINTLRTENEKLISEISRDEGLRDTLSNNIPQLKEQLEKSESKLNMIQDEINQLPNFKIVDTDFNIAKQHMYQSVKGARRAYRGSTNLEGLSTKIQSGILNLNDYTVQLEPLDSELAQDYVSFKYINNNTGIEHTHDYIINEIETKIDSIYRTAHGIDEDKENVIETKGLKEVVHETMNQAKENAQHIIDVQQQAEMDDNISYYVEWKKRTNQSGSTNNNAVKVSEARRLINLFESNTLNEKDTNAIFKEIEAKIDEEIKQGNLDNDFDLDIKNNEDFLYEIIKDIFNYKEWYQFELYERQQNQTDKKPLTNKSFSSNSNGQINRLKFEMVLSAIESDKTVMNREDAPIILVLEEAFSMMDETIKSYLLKRIHKNNINFVFNAPKFSLPHMNNYPMTINTFTLEPTPYTNQNDEEDVEIDVYPNLHISK